jgi:hypothetical protein
MANTLILKRSSEAGKEPTSAQLQVGEIAVNLSDKKLYSKNAAGEVILVGSGSAVDGNVGFEIKNQTGSTIPKGTLVGFAGTLGTSGVLLVSPFLANGSQPSEYVVGILSTDVPDGGDGFAVDHGKITGLNTSAFAAGTILYASATTAGALVSTIPSAPNNKITVAAVVNSSSTAGILEVRITLGSRLGNDEQVQLTSLANNDVIRYNSSNSRFENTAQTNLAAGTANTLATARTINGTSFNGSANITTANWGTSRTINGSSVNGSANVTTANWGTARNLTIGNNTKSVNGGANVSWSLGEIEAEYRQPINTIRNNLGDPTTREMALFHGQFNNKFRFISPTLQEESTDGNTWVTSTRANANQLGDLVRGEGEYGSFNAIPSAAVGVYGAYRLTWDVVGTTGYVYLNNLYFYNSTNGNTVTALVEAFHNTNGWTTITGPHNFNNWPGHTHIPHSTIPYSNNSSQYNKVRVTFTTTHNANINAFTLYGIEWFGGYPAGKRNVESYDRNKNVTFPASISTPSQFISTVSTGTAPLTVSSTTRVANLNVTTAGSADTLTTARTIGGVSFNGSANINLPGVNTAGNQSTTGNAATATTLQTARTINGTSFNGSANITTANWGTTRTLTIGSTGKSVNGSGDVSWSLAEIGAYAATNPSGFITSSASITGNAATATQLIGYQLPNTGGSSSYIYLGRWNNAPQSGSKLRIQIAAAAGYNASIGQNAVTDLYFKTSNGSSVQSGSTGSFFADAVAWRHGDNSVAPTLIRIVQVDSNTYDFYGNFGAFTGDGSFYSPQIVQGNWVNSSTIVSTPTGNFIDITPRLWLDSSNYNSYSPTLTGGGASGTWGINITGSSASTTGNAATATTLQTTRAINGTNFDGSANITTSNWGTARNLTIGGTAKSVNGSANVAWSLSEIGAQATLVSGTNIKTINDTSILGSGNISINSGGVTSFNTRTGDVTLGFTDIDSGLTTLSGPNSLVLGGAYSSATSSVILGRSVPSSGSSFSNSVVVGNSPTVYATGSDSVAIGNNTQVYNQSVVIGHFARTQGLKAVAIGENSFASSSNTVVVGQGSTASNLRSVAIGQNTTASGSQAVALGSDLSASQTNEFKVRVRVNPSGNTPIPLFYDQIYNEIYAVEPTGGGGGGTSAAVQIIASAAVMPYNGLTGSSRGVSGVTWFGPGTYFITFTNPLPASAKIIVSLGNDVNWGPNSIFIASYLAINSGYAEVYMFDAFGAGADYPFTFIVTEDL